MTRPTNRLATLAATIGIVIAIIAVKIIAAALGLGQNAAPGIERGDFVLKENDLPKTVDSWTKSAFTPAKKSDELAQGEYWWTHSWNYKSDSSEAIVSFDQADWIDWHDLTACYRMSGWTMKSRDVRSEDAWPYVIATYERSGATAILVFSMFYDDGAPVPPAAFEATDNGGGLIDDLRIRNENSQVRFTGRAFQCQVFTLGDPEGTIELHLASRQAFRNATVFRSNSPGTRQ